MYGKTFDAYLAHLARISREQAGLEDDPHDSELSPSKLRRLDAKNKTVTFSSGVGGGSGSGAVKGSVNGGGKQGNGGKGGNSGNGGGGLGVGDGGVSGENGQGGKKGIGKKGGKDGGVGGDVDVNGVNGGGGGVEPAEFVDNEDFSAYNIPQQTLNDLKLYFSVMSTSKADSDSFWFTKDDATRNK